MGSANDGPNVPSNVTVSSHPLVRALVCQLRDKETVSKDFRDILKKIGQLLCYEATNDIPVVKHSSVPMVCPTF